MGRLWGVGEKTGEILSRLAVRTVGDLASTPEAILARLLGEQHARHLSQLSPRHRRASLEPYEAPKSMGHEETFEHDVDDDETLLQELLALSGKVGSSLRADGYRARTVTMKVRLATFTTLTRSKTLTDATDVGADLYHTVADLYRPCPGSGGGSACSACRPAAWSPPGPSSSRCSEGNGGGRGAGRRSHRAPLRPRLGDAGLAARSLDRRDPTELIARPLRGFPRRKLPIIEACP